jgi:uncharacterized metal-binding protein YceD (DUF177 family)
MTATTQPSPEFSRPVPVEPLAPEGRTLTVEADADERERLAARFGLARLDRFSGAVTLRPLGARRGVVRVELSGSFEADAVQTCVVTLVPLPCHVAEPVHLRFSSEPDDDTGADLDIDPEADDDPPDPIVDGMIDVGETLAEALGLALDPHPRAPGATLQTADFPARPDVGTDQDDAPSPFAALAALKTGRTRD